MSRTTQRLIFVPVDYLDDPATLKTIEALIAKKNVNQQVYFASAPADLILELTTTDPTLIEAANNSAPEIELTDIHKNAEEAKKASTERRQWYEMLAKEGIKVTVTTIIRELLTKVI